MDLGRVGVFCVFISTPQRLLPRDSLFHPHGKTSFFGQECVPCKQTRVPAVLGSRGSGDIPAKEHESLGRAIGARSDVIRVVLWPEETLLTTEAGERSSAMANARVIFASRRRLIALLMLLTREADCPPFLLQMML